MYNWILENRRYLVVIVLGTLFFHYEVFFGHNFFVDGDVVAVYQHAHGNAMGNGWRPEKIFGQSFFFGDPGVFHAWSPFVFWDRLFVSGEHAYSASILILLVLVSFSQFYFLRFSIPQLSGWLATILSMLVVLGPLRYEFFFQRHWIALSICTPLIIRAIHLFLTKPELRYICYGGLVLWFSWFFGGFPAFSQIILVGLVFVIVHCATVRTTIKTYLFRGVRFFAFTLPIVGLLGAWCFYPIWLENLYGDFVRITPDRVQVVGSSFAGGIDLLQLTKFFYEIFVSEWLNYPQTHIFGGEILWQSGWVNAVPVFPIIFLFILFWRSNDYWLAVIKAMLLVFLIHELLGRVFPGYIKILSGEFTYGYNKFQPAYHMLEIMLIGKFLCHLSYVRKIQLKTIGHILIWMAAIIGILSFCIFIFIGLASNIYPNVLIAVVERLYGELINAEIFGVPELFVSDLIAENVRKISKTYYWYSYLYFVLGVFLILLISKRINCGANWQWIIAVLLLVCNVGHAWHAFPLNQQELVWDQDFVEPMKVSPVSRFYRYSQPRKQYLDELVRNEESDLFEKYFTREWDGKFGAREWYTGYLLTPALNASSHTHVWDEEVADLLIKTSANDRGVIRDMRSLEGGQVVDSIFDVAAVSHYYASRPIFPLPHQLKPIFSGKQLFVYQNSNAWPYFYLADTLDATTSGQLPKFPEMGTAYIEANKEFMLEPDIERFIILKDFSYGRMSFSFSSTTDQLLIIADKWHPFWKARAANRELEVIKANQIFKGIVLPSGTYDFELLFDTSKYRLGILISILSGLALLLFLMFPVFREWFFRNRITG